MKEAEDKLTIFFTNKKINLLIELKSKLKHIYLDPTIFEYLIVYLTKHFHDSQYEDINITIQFFEDKGLNNMQIKVKVSSIIPANIKNL